MRDAATAAKENQVAGQHSIEANFFTLFGLRRRRGRYIDAKFFQRKTRETGAIKPSGSAATAMHILDADKILCISCDVLAQLHYLLSDGAGQLRVVVAENRTGEKNEEEKEQ